VARQQPNHTGCFGAHGTSGSHLSKPIIYALGSNVNVVQNEPHLEREVSTMAPKKSTLTIALPGRNALIAIGLSLVTLIGASIAMQAPAAIVVPVTYTVTDQYGGVFGSDSTCEPRSTDFSWVAGDVTIASQDATGLPTDLTATASIPSVARSSATDCTWTFFVSINPPDVEPLNRLVGQGQFPQSLGVFDMKIGNESIGSIAPVLVNNIAVNLKRSIAVTNTIYGVARLGDLNARCTGDSGNLPTEWNCTGRQSWDGLGWIGWYSYNKYRNIEKFRVINNKKDESKSKCWGVNGFKDFKIGAKVTITGDDGVLTTSLVESTKTALPRTVPMQYYKWYLASKSSKVTVCHFAWLIPDVPFSESGYTVKIGARDPKTVTFAELEQGDWLMFTDYGNVIPDYTKN